MQHNVSYRLAADGNALLLSRRHTQSRAYHNVNRIVMIPRLAAHGPMLAKRSIIPGETNKNDRYDELCFILTTDGGSIQLLIIQGVSGEQERA